MWGENGEDSKNEQKLRGGESYGVFVGEHRVNISQTEMSAGFTSLGCRGLSVVGCFAPAYVCTRVC